MLANEVEKYEAAFNLFDREEIAQRIIESWVHEAEVKIILLNTRIREFQALSAHVQKSGLSA